MKEKQSKLSTAGYKGTRDFYPEDMRVRNYLFSVMRGVVESYGYEEYDGPMIESLDLYRAKTGEEIVGKQIYDFIDKGGREVAIRPEMTPTLARMVAGKSRELVRPIRWFSFPNLWRYEQPGHGRLREHWQLNVDIFGVDDYRAEMEIIQLACEILRAFGADASMFRVKISHRKLLDQFFLNALGLNPEKAQAVSKILDKKNKISVQEYHQEVQNLIPEKQDAVETLDLFLGSSLETLGSIPGIDPELVSELATFFRNLKHLGLGDYIEFDPSIVRGFDYYTGYVYEIFDTSPENRRSLYGGGRYDNLTGLFSNDSISGTGFGLGDVTLRNFLETHNLLPNISRTDIVYIPLMEESLTVPVFQLAKDLRDQGIKTEINLNFNQKFGKQLSLAEKKGYKLVLICGTTEMESGEYGLKNLETREQVQVNRAELVSAIKKAWTV